MFSQNLAKVNDYLFTKMGKAASLECQNPCSLERGVNLSILYSTLIPCALIYIFGILKKKLFSSLRKKGQLDDILSIILSYVHKRSKVKCLRSPGRESNRLGL